MTEGAHPSETGYGYLFSPGIIAFGQAYIANPDLAERYRDSLPLNRPVIATYCTQGEEGYRLSRGNRTNGTGV